MDLETHFGDFPVEAAKKSFLEDEPWQPARSYVEKLCARPDWGERIIAMNLCFEPVVGLLIRRELLMRSVKFNGDLITQAVNHVAQLEWEWARGWTAELVRFVCEDAEHGAANREVVGDGWPSGCPRRTQRRRRSSRSSTRSRRALHFATLALTCRSTWTSCSKNAESRLAAAHERRRQRNLRLRRDRDGEERRGRCRGGRPRRPQGVEIIEQPSFWDIRAKDRLVINFDEVGEQLGFDIDPYAIQHEMSTHYGRLIVTDDALMLFSDPVEAMEHLTD